MLLIGKPDENQVAISCGGIALDVMYKQWAADENRHGKLPRKH
jgi:hypothetical protein